MNNAKGRDCKKFLLAFFCALMLLLAVFFVYSRYIQKAEKKPVAICGKVNRT